MPTEERLTSPINTAGSAAFPRFAVPRGTRADHVEADTFKAVMGAFPTGVTVVTTTDSQGFPCGFTCSAACSVSQDPPLLLICADSGSRVLREITERGRFVVNFLRSDRGWVSALFASKRPDRFTSIEWRPSRRHGLPWLSADTIAHAECEVAATVEAGDHVVVIGTILDGDVLSEPDGPLMYWRRQYAGWPTEDAVTAGLTMATEG